LVRIRREVEIAPLGMAHSSHDDEHVPAAP
jgi:hypothetical protein